MYDNEVEYSMLDEQNFQADCDGCDWSDMYRTDYDEEE